MSPSYDVKIERDSCKGCNLCIFHCPTKYLKISSQLNKKGVKFAEVSKQNKCIGCGFCFLICPDTCIEVFEFSERNCLRKDKNKHG